MKTTNRPEAGLSPKSTYPTWGDLMAIIGVLIVVSLLCGIVKMALEKSGSASAGFTLFICYTVQFCVVIAFALWQKWRRGGQRPLLQFSLRGANPAIILWGVILTAAMSLLIEPVINIFPDTYLQMLQDAVGTGGWAMLTTIICAPILEEILFRGVIQHSITQKWGKISGVLITSLIFGAIHIIPPQAINAFFVSLVIGYIYIKSGSLIAVIIIHSINNAIAYLGMSLNDGKIETTREMIGNDTIYNVVYAVAAVVFIIAVVGVVRGMRKPKTKKDIDKEPAIDNNVPE